MEKRRKKNLWQQNIVENFPLRPPLPLLFFQVNKSLLTLEKKAHREDDSSSMGGVKIEMKASRTGGKEDIKKLRLNKRLVDFRKSCHKRQQQQQQKQAQPSSRKIKTDHKMTHLTYICPFVGVCECVCVWVLKIFRFSSCGDVCLCACVCWWV